MRISGGTAKGRKVGTRKAFVAKGGSDELRPTAAKVRKAIFDIVGARVLESRFLDLYAGTGAVGIEALSRGAEHVVFVENNAARVVIIRELIGKFGFAGSASVLKTSASLFLGKSSYNSFDIIFVDPPYASDEIERVLPVIDGSGILAEDGIVIIEHSSKKTLSLPLTKLRQKKNYRYGDTALTLYVNSGEKSIPQEGEHS
ncbi:MAG TPA: 16S rRNA (guanine(966)-N(2))-methyltransferase RsmD [Dissulfurispiraceae bacterium]|nr:16S rRNA (guanine(966)-N(2))-methyltransferase RsmD [Dissulfurispiraceae bacterium]